MKKIIILISAFVLLSCKDSVENEEIKDVKTIEKVNENLLYFDLELVEDVHIEDKNETELYQINNLKINYIEDIIYVKAFINTNACDDFKGNIEFDNNKLKLKLNNISDEPCMSNSKFEVRFIIKNKKGKKYNINCEVK